MEINYNDALQQTMLNWKYYDKNIDPFYGCLISYLIEVGGYKLSKDGSERDQVKKIGIILKSDPKIFKGILKILMQNEFSGNLGFRYQYRNTLYKSRDEENRFSILKFKIIDGKLYVYDLIASRENRKYVEIKKINNVDANELIALLKNDGYSEEEIEILLQHKEVLQAYGIDSLSYIITVLNNNNLINVQLDDPNIKLDFSIFYKEHAKSNLLTKTNFSLKQGTSNNNASYGYDSNIKLLFLLHGLCKSPKDLSFFENVYKKNIGLLGDGSSTEINVDWMFLSSFFLFNREEKNTLPDYLYLDLERKLKLVSQYGAMCIFLDENNKEVSYQDDSTQSNYGSNDYILKDGKLDSKMLFHAIRNALAHSSYEVIDKNYIRIFGYNNEGVMNCNFKIHRDMVIEFINKLSTYNNFGNIFPICTLEEPNYANNPILTKEDLKNYLESIIISNITNVKYQDLDFLKKLQMYAQRFVKEENKEVNKNIDYKFLEALEYDYERKIHYLKQELQNPMTIKTEFVEFITQLRLRYFLDCKLEECRLSEAQINKIIFRIEQISDTLYGHSATNQHAIITELIRDEINPSRNISMIIEDIIETSGKSSGTIMDMLNETSIKYIDYDKVLKATIIAYLNNILLYSYNGTKVDFSDLNFSKLKCDIDFEALISVKQKRLNDLRRENSNICKTNRKKKKRISDITIILERITDEEEKNRLIEEKQILEDSLRQDDGSRQEENIKEMTDLINDLEDLNNRRLDSSCISAYILEHLRNSLAHGNIFFSDTIDLNDIGDLEITFIDYYPDTTDESFKGTIKLEQLLTILNNDKFISSIFANAHEKSIDNHSQKS